MAAADDLLSFKEDEGCTLRVQLELIEYSIRVEEMVYAMLMVCPKGVLSEVWADVVARIG